jgi:hypothetical protein
VIGRVGSEVVVPGGVCVRTGVPTRQFVIIRGSTVPRWVHVLLPLTFLGWIFASGMASRRYRVEVPFVHRQWDRWNRLRLAAWAIALSGVIMTCGAALADVPHAGSFLCLTAGGVVLGVGNGLANTVGFVQRGDLLLMTRVHPDAVAAIRAARSDARRVSHPGAEAGSA